MIAAPTGSGKTALLTDWIGRQRGRRMDHGAGNGQRSVAWLSLDPRDDLLPFLRYLVAACQTIVPSAGALALSLLQDGLAQLPPVPTLLTPLINDLAAGAVPGILVLDDYHVVAGTPAATTSSPSWSTICPPSCTS